MVIPEDTLESGNNSFLTFVDKHRQLRCYTDHQGNLRIHPQENEQYWYLQQAQERWLLIVHNVAQILFAQSEAKRFIKRWLKAQAESDR